MKRQILSIFSALMIVLPGLAAADVEALMQGCNDCHGDNGVSLRPSMVFAFRIALHLDEGRNTILVEEQVVERPSVG